MIYIDRLLNIYLSDDRTAEVLVTTDTLTLFVATEPVLHVELDHEDEPVHRYFQIHYDCAVDPSDIREALDYMMHNYLDDATLTDEEYKALPVLHDIDISCFDLST